MIYIALNENNILIRNMIRAFNYAFNIVHTYKVCNKILCKDRSVILFLYFTLLCKNYILLYLHFTTWRIVVNIFPRIILPLHLNLIYFH